MHIKQLPRTLAVGVAATMFGAAACSPAPAEPENGPPLSSGGDTGTGGSGSAATAGSGATETGGTGGAEATGGGAGAGGMAAEGGDEGQDTDTGGKGSGVERGGSQADAGTETGGGAPASSPGCREGAFLCEGFEDYAVDAPPEGGWTREGGARQENGPGSGGTDVDTTHVFSGEKSLHVTGKLVEDQSSIKKTLDLKDPVTFVRLMMYTVNYPDQNIHTRIVSLGTEREKETYSLGTWNAVAIEKVNSVYLQNDDNRFGQASFENRWVCWEFSIDQTGGMGKVKPTIWLDGEELPLRKAGSASHGGTTDSWDPIDFKYIWVGLFGYQGSRESYDYWVDDLIVDSERIGCPDAN